MLWEERKICQRFPTQGRPSKGDGVGTRLGHGNTGGIHEFTHTSNWGGLTSRLLPSVLMGHVTSKSEADLASPTGAG